jgi:hypothetical protein
VGRETEFFKGSGQPGSSQAGLPLVPRVATNTWESLRNPLACKVTITYGRCFKISSSSFCSSTRLYRRVRVRVSLLLSSMPCFLEGIALLKNYCCVAGIEICCILANTPATDSVTIAFETWKKRIQPRRRPKR